MNYRTDCLGQIRRIRLLRTATSLFLLLFATVISTMAAVPTATGSIAGTVTSAATGNALQGATVAIPTLGQTVLTDQSGYFVLSDVPAGVVEITVHYTGFTESRMPVNVSATSGSRVDVAMKSSDVVTMDKFTVATVREGQALSITEQRNAVNPKNVVALDEWGVLPTQNVGELLTRMPGVSFSTDEDDLINSVNIRGLVSSNGQSLTRLVVDGMSSTGVGGNGRTATMHSFSAAMYEQLEVIAGQTPDRRADSIGGQINLKTRSPLAMRESQRFQYDLSGRLTPATNKRNADLAKHPYGYVGTMGYTGVFDVLGGNRNLGINVNVAQQEIVSQFDYDVMQYNNVLDPNLAFFRDYDKRSGTNHRFITGLGARADYRVSRNTTVSLRFIYNAGSEPFFHYTWINPFLSTTANIGLYDPSNPSSAGGMMPGSNSSRTEIRPVGNAQMLLTPRRWSFTSTNPTETLVFEHDFGSLKIDHAWRMSRTHWDSNSGRQREGGQLTMRTRDPIGFILDSSNPDGRVFTQTAGPSVYDPASYQSFIVTARNITTAPVDQTSIRLDKRGTVTNTDEWSGTINATYTLPFRYSMSLKGGVDTVNRRVNNFQVNPLRWYLQPGQYLSGLALMPMTTFEQNQGGQRLPVFDPVAVSETVNDTTKWARDDYFTAVQNLSSSRHVKESVDAAYLQDQFKIGAFTVLGGARIEKVKTSTFTFFRARTLNATGDFVDPVKRATAEFSRQGRNGEYTKLFPSVHGTYDITANLKARASWSTSYARPDMLQLIPGVTVSDTAQTVTIGNPDLKPMLAKNIDLKLEYYTSTGLYSAGAFQKNITDYLPAAGINYGGTGSNVVPSTPDNGFDGLYGGYTILSPRNIGKLTIEGLEFDFRQRLTFLPGALKGLTVRGNYTIVRGDGQFVFSSTQVGFLDRKTRDIPGIVPHMGNIGLLYTYGKFGASYDVNYTSEYADASAANVGTPGTPSYIQYMIYRKSLVRMNAGITYRVRPNATVYLNVNNLRETGPDRYTYVTSRPRQHTIVPMSIVAGVSGQF